MYIKQHKVPWIRNLQNPQNLILNNHSIATVLNTNNKITHHVTGQQALGWILPTCLHTDCLEYVTKGHIYNIILNLKWLYSLFLNGTTNISLLITCNRLSITQASSSFKRFDTHTSTYATPTFITEALHLVTLVQLLLMTVAVN